MSSVKAVFLIQFLLALGLSFSGCAPKNADPQAKPFATKQATEENKTGFAKKPLSPKERLISRPDCKVILNTTLLDVVTLKESHEVRDSSILKFELEDGPKVKIDQDFKTCFLPLLPGDFSCRTTHADSVFFSYTEISQGFMLKKDSGEAWGFISPGPNEETAELTSFDESLKTYFGRDAFELKINRCH